jgi:predicted membrane protein
MGMGGFRRVLYNVLIGITLGTMFPLVAYLVFLMRDVLMNVFMLLAFSFALSTLYTAIIALLSYLHDRSEQESQG